MYRNREEGEGLVKKRTVNLLKYFADISRNRTVDISTDIIKKARGIWFEVRKDILRHFTLYSMFHLWSLSFWD